MKIISIVILIVSASFNASAARESKLSGFGASVKCLILDVSKDGVRIQIGEKVLRVSAEDVCLDGKASLLRVKKLLKNGEAQIANSHQNLFPILHEEQNEGTVQM